MIRLVAFILLLLVCLAPPRAMSDDLTAAKIVSKTKPAENSADKPLNSLSPHEDSRAPKSVAGEDKTAYFNSGRVSAALPSQRRRQLLMAQAESQLRQAAKEAIDVLQKMHKEGRSAVEISAEENRRKILVENQQKALAELVGKSQAEGRAEIEAAVASIADRNGLTLVLDLDGIYFGGNNIRNSGRDITAEIIRKLSQ